MVQYRCDSVKERGKSWLYLIKCFRSLHPVVFWHSNLVKISTLASLWHVVRTPKICRKGALFISFQPLSLFFNHEWNAVTDTGLRNQADLKLVDFELHNFSQRWRKRQVIFFSLVCCWDGNYCSISFSTLQVFDKYRLLHGWWVRTIFIQELWRIANERASLWASEFAILHNKWIKIIQANQPWSYLFIL